MNMKTLDKTILPDIHTAGDESPPQGNGFQPSAQIMSAPSPAASFMDADSFESKISEPDSKAQVVTAVPSASKTKGETHDHSKALQYLQDLSDKIEAERGQETMDKVYEQLDYYQDKSSSLTTFGFDRQFGLSAGNEETTEDKEFAILVYILVLEEAYIDINAILKFDKTAHEQTMQDYIKSAARSFHQLDEDVQQVIGDLYDFMGGDVY